MTGLRERVRTSIPGSTELYEAMLHSRRRRASRRIIRDLAQVSGPLRLDIGGGGKPGVNGWTTVDTAAGCDLYWDLREGIPFATGAVDAIYSSHLLEHLPFDDGQALLQECLRALRPGGTISIAVPNARMYIESYMGMREIPAEYFGWAPAVNNTTSIDAVNYVAYMGGEHRYLFDQENLVERLRLAGFDDARARDFDPDVDSPERAFESVYAIASKAAEVT